MATGTPDQLTVDLGVVFSGSDARDALAADDATTGAVLAALQTGGVATGDVQTTGLSLQPQYSRTGALTGYSVTDSVVATLRDFGSVIDAAATAGGDAVHQAASHAASMAAAGERLGPVCSITDLPTSIGAPPRAGTFAPVGTAGNSAVRLQPGAQRASAQVTLVHALTEKSSRD